MSDSFSDPPGGALPGDSPPDDGVTERLARRATAGAWTAICLGAGIAVSVWVWPRWVHGSFGVMVTLVLMALLVGWAGVLLRRGRLWSMAADLLRDDLGSWVTASCGDPVATRRPRRHFRRLTPLTAAVLPLRTASGPLVTGAATIVHGRHDALVLSADDAITVCTVARKGPFLIRRTSDDVVFVADCWVLSAW